MDYHFATKSQLEEFLDLLPMIGSGAEGECYYCRGKVIKIFHEWLTEIPNKETILEQQKMSLPTVLFPDGIVYIQEEMVGYTMPYVQAIPIKEYDFTTVPFLDLISAMKKAINVIQKLSSGQIRLMDSCDTNILFDGLSFYFIDTLDYEKQDKNSALIYKENMRAFAIWFLQALVVSIGRKNMNGLFHFVPCLLTMWNENWCYCLPLFLETLQQEMEEIYGTQVTSIASILEENISKIEKQKRK